MRSRLVISSSCLAILGVVACSSDPGPAGGGDGAGSSTPTQAAKVVGTQGGTVATSDGSASVDIPEGALPADTTITITQTPDAPDPAGTAVAGTPYKFGPDGLKFLKPITVTLAYDPSKLPAGVDASKLVVFTAPDGSLVYEKLPTTVKDPSHVTATTTHFSTDVAAVPGDPTDAGVDAGDCYVTCTQSASTATVDAGVGGGGGGGGTPSYGCQCTATCNNKQYVLDCPQGATSCSCMENSSTTNASAGAPSTVCANNGALAAYNGTCGFPGTLAPASDASTDAGTDASTSCTISCAADAGIGQPVACVCTTSCNGHAYAMDCGGSTSCSCTTDGTSTGTATSASNPCGDVTAMATAFNSGCGYPGSFPTSTTPDAGSSDAGTPSMDGGGFGGDAGFGGGGGTTDGGGFVTDAGVPSADAGAPSTDAGGGGTGGGQCGVGTIGTGGGACAPCTSPPCASNQTPVCTQGTFDFQSMTCTMPSTCVCQ